LSSSIKSTPSRTISTHIQRVGKWGEAIAAEFVTARGYEIIEKNFHTHSGELDMIASHDGQTVFIEVKTRSNTKTGFPEDGMTPKKVSHLVEAAQEYLESHPELPEDWKIDVVAIVGRPGEYQIELFDDISYEI
jgi:putative endonuclease